MSEQPRAQQPSEKAGETVSLTQTEERQVRERTGLRAAVVFESVRREGESELERAPWSLAFSGLSAGLSMGFSLVTMGLLRAALPDARWRTLIETFGYCVGFIIVVLGRQQLFTENTVTVILPLLDDPRKSRVVMKVARLWAIVLAANLIGAGIFAFALAHIGAFDPATRSAFASLAHEAAGSAFWPTVVSGIFAGWLIAMMVWLLPGADAQRLWVILIITYVVGLGGFSHVVAGSVETLYGVAIGTISWAAYFGGFLLPVFIGNAIGGVLLVSILNYAQLAPENAGD
ncbi:MAG: formate/nitrite transporter family protein [Candidatus Tumulicola sp.]